MSLRKVAKALFGASAIIVLGISIFIWNGLNRMNENAGRMIEWGTEDGKILRNEKYGEGTRNTYDLFLPAKAKSDALILFIHGGSWVSGDKEDIEWAARYYAKKGFVTATVNYSRLSKDKAVLDNFLPDPSIISMMAEIDMAIKSIKTKCHSIGYNLSQMAIGGYSAGGHLAMLYTSQYSNQSPLPIRFQISWVGPSDFTLLFPTDKNLGSEIREDSCKYEEYIQFMYYLSGDTSVINACNVAIEDSLKRTVSPLYHINPATPPAILVYGAKDQLVKAEHGIRFRNALEKLGIENKLYIFPNSGHELGFDAEYTDSVYSGILDFSERFFQ